MERDAFHVSYLSDKIPEAVFHGQAVKTVAYLRVSTAQQDLRSQIIFSVINLCISFKLTATISKY